ncbi:hypothetical protein Tco_1575508 [Tanacetum coccineum]
MYFTTVLKSTRTRPSSRDKDPGVSASSELFALACGPTPTPISINSCLVNGVRFVVHSCDECRTTQNNGICSPGDKDGEMYYGQLEEILEFLYMTFKVVLFRDDHDVIHFDNSYDLALSTSLNYLDFATLHIDGQSIDVDALPNIIDVEEDDDIIDDEDALPHDLADSDDEDLVNVDDDDNDDVMSADVARGHGGDGGGDDRPYPHQIGDGYRGHPKTQLGRQESQQAEYPQGNQEPRTQFDLTPHMQSDLWSKIKKGIDQHLAKIYTDNKSSLKMESFATREYPSMIQTYFDTHTVDGVFLRDEERLLYVRGHIPDVGRVLAGRGRDIFMSLEPRCTHIADVDELKGTNKQLKKQMDMFMKVVRSDDKMSKLLT